MEEPVVEPAVEPGSEAPEAPWAPAREDWEQLSSAVGYLASLEQQRAAVYQPNGNGEQRVGLDPFADTFEDQLRAAIRQELTPFQQFQQETQLAEAEERAMDILSSIGSRDGEFDVNIARLRADALLAQTTQMYGPGVKAAEAALELAAKEQREYEQQMRSRYVNEHTNQIATLAGAPGEPGSEYTVGTQVRTMPDYRQGGTVTGRFFGPNRES